MDPALIPLLHVLEAKSSAEQAAFFTSVLVDGNSLTSPAAKAAHATFCFAAMHGMDAPTLEAALHDLGLGHTCAAAAAQCWGTHGDDVCYGLISQSTNIHQLVDLDWKFGGMLSLFFMLRECRPSLIIVDSLRVYSVGEQQRTRGDGANIRTVAAAYQEQGCSKVYSSG